MMMNPETGVTFFENGERGRHSGTRCSHWKPEKAE